MFSTNDIVSLDLGASFTYADIIRFEHIYDAGLPVVLQSTLSSVHSVLSQI